MALRGEDEEDDDESAGTPELTELIDSDVELRHWVAPDGGPARAPKGQTGVADGELCYTAPHETFEPFETEHEGYTGNAGNTVDHWYHRAAVVLWPRARAFVIRAQVDPHWALRQIEKALAAKRTDEAGALARQLLPFWIGCVRREEKLLEPTLKVAGPLADAETAAALLKPFSLWVLNSRLAPRLTQLLERYGLDWCRALLKHWTVGDRGYEPPETRLKWMSAALAGLSRALAARESPGRTLAAEVLAAQWAWLRRHWAEVLKMECPEAERAKALAALGRPTLGLIEACRAAEQAGLRREVLDALIEQPGDLLPLQIGVLRTAHGSHRPEALRALGLKRVYESCTRELDARLRAPTRSPNDWSITVALSCSCQRCATLTRFLRAAGQRRLDWPLAQAGRSHVHQTIDSRDLPVTHATRRVGRPFTLVLEKTPKLFEREAAERRMAQEELKWLEGMGGRV